MEMIFIAMLINAAVTIVIENNMSRRKITTLNNRKSVPMVRKRSVKRDWVSNIIAGVLTGAIIVAVVYSIIQIVKDL